MILLKRHHQGPEPPAHYRPTRRLRLGDSSAMAVPPSQSSAITSTIPKSTYSSATIPSTCPSLSAFPSVNFPTSFVRKRQSCLPEPPRTAATMCSLPSELLLQVLSHLPLIDITQVAQTCRKFYILTQDSSLQKHLDLSGLHMCYPPASIATLLTTAHSLTIIPPSTTTSMTTTAYPPPLSIYESTLHHSFYNITSSSNLTSITLRALPRKYIGQLHFLFTHLQTQNLQHVDLARTYVPNHLFFLIALRYGSTLVSLDLEFAVITDLALGILERPGKLPKLRELGLAGCLGLTEGGLKRLLCMEDGGMGVGVEVLDLRWGMDVEVEWVEGWLQRRQAANIDGRVIAGSVDIRGCERITNKGVEELRGKWPGVQVKFTPKGSVRKL